MHQQNGLKFKKDTNQLPHWSIASYGTEWWTLRKVDQKYLEIEVNIYLFYVYTQQ